MSINTDNGRYYMHPTKRKSVPSITNIKNMKSIDALKYAAARDAADYAADNRAKLAGLERQEAFQLVKSAPFVMTPSSPAKVGDVVHNWVDRYAKGQAIPGQEIGRAVITARHMWEQFGQFTAHYRKTAALEFVDSEFTVWSDQWNYAGTADLALKLNGALVLADTKTGKQAYPDMALQLAAIAYADVILTPDGEERPMPKWEGFAILHLRPASFQLIPVHHVEEAFRGFLGLKAAFDWQVEYGDKTLGYAPRFGTREVAA
jgi:hypothetical protein